MRYWFFQANPTRFDISSALLHLTTIAWRAPQYTSGIAPGDVAVIWRSGAEAGIVAIGRVVSQPQVLSPSPAEAPFVLGSEEPNDVTRVILRVVPVPLISKERVAAAPDMAAHQLFSAPMGTVFPITEEQWAGLEALLPSPPPLEPGDPTTDLPATFSWADRRKSVYPLPGGYDGYITSLREVLGYVTSGAHSRPDLSSWIRAKYGPAFADLVPDFLRGISILQLRGDRWELAPIGQVWFKQQDGKLLIGLLHSRVRFIGEMLEYLREAHSVPETLAYANDRYSMGWSSSAQVNRRRGWLQSAGFLNVSVDGALNATEDGLELLQQLELHRPVGSSPPEIARSGPEPNPRIDPPHPVAPGLALIASRLRELMHHTVAPSEFEEAVANAFRFLGFDSAWVGGPGNTDVVLIADLGPGEAYRVIIDCKTTTHDAVSDPQIDWVTLREHRGRHVADFVSVVGCAFTSSRVITRAREQGVVLIDVETLVSLCEQHWANPVGLDVYRRLFAADDATAGAAAVAEAMEESQRWATLAAAVVQQVDVLERNEGSVDRTDLYWNVKRLGDQFEWVLKEDIQGVLDALASPALGVLRQAPDGGYRDLGSLITTGARLRHLASLVELQLIANGEADG